MSSVCTEAFRTAGGGRVREQWVSMSWWKDTSARRTLNSNSWTFSEILNWVYLPLGFSSRIWRLGLASRCLSWYKFAVRNLSRSFLYLLCQAFGETVTHPTVLSAYLGGSVPPFGLLWTLSVHLRTGYKYPQSWQCSFYLPTNHLFAKLADTLGF